MSSAELPQTMMSCAFVVLPQTMMSWAIVELPHTMMSLRRGITPDDDVFELS